MRIVKPGATVGADGATEAPHLDVSVFARGLLNRLVTRIYFADEEDANATDPFCRCFPPTGAPPSSRHALRTATTSTSISKARTRRSSSMSEPGPGLFDAVLAAAEPAGGHDATRRGCRPCSTPKRRWRARARRWAWPPPATRHAWGSVAAPRGSTSVPSARRRRAAVTPCIPLVRGTARVRRSAGGGDRPPGRHQPGHPRHGGDGGRPPGARRHPR